jgi:5-formyltetrahydrofolate cyclo-ligase
MDGLKMDWPEIRAWRKQARQKMLAARAAIAQPARAALSQHLIAQLKPVLEGRPPPISFYWPIKAEPDLRPLMRELDAADVAVCLPVATKLGEPLRFRPWRRGCPMERGFWDIPVPATPEEIEPRTLIAPIVGFDPQGYRLGYGGGFFDRTLEKYGPEARAIGIGYSMFELKTIHPQPHDVRMSAIVTERARFLTDARVSPPSSEVCYATEVDAAYAGFADDAEIAAGLSGLRGDLAPERAALVDYILWRLGTSRDAAPNGSGGMPRERLTQLLPRVRDDVLHAALSALRDSLVPEIVP